MLRLSQRMVRPTLARALRVRAFANSLHTLPDLPYAYDVRVLVFPHSLVALWNLLNFEPYNHITGFRTPHFERNHDPASQETPPDVRERTQRGGRIPRQGQNPVGFDFSSACNQV